MYCTQEWLIIGSWIGAGFLGGAIMYGYLTWKLDKHGWTWEQLVKKKDKPEPLN